MEKTLYVSDLDGTLLGKDARLSAESVSMLNEAISEGALFSIATARTPATVAGIMSGIRPALPYIVMTGAAMWDARDGKYSAKETFAPETAALIAGHLRKAGLPAFLYTLEREVIDIYHIGELDASERAFIAGRDDPAFKIFHIPSGGDSALPREIRDAVLFYAMQVSDKTEAAYESIKDIRECNALCYRDIYGEEASILEVFAAGATKAKALERLKRECGADRTVVFGDNINDLPMMRAADIAIAVENAVEAVKAEADLIIGPNTDNSVARYIWEQTRR